MSIMSPFGSRHTVFAILASSKALYARNRGKRGWELAIDPHFNRKSLQPSNCDRQLEPAAVMDDIPLLKRQCGQIIRRANVTRLHCETHSHKQSNRCKVISLKR